MKHVTYLVLLVSSAIGCTLVSSATTPTPDYLSESMRRVQFGSALTSLAACLESYFSGKGAFSQLPEASNLTVGFVNDIANQNGIDPDFQVKIGPGYAASIGTILVPYDPEQYFLRSTLDSSLLKYNYPTDKDELEAATNELYEHMGVLDHEFTHYKNHDLRNSLIFISLLNIAIYSTFFTYEYKMLSEKLRRANPVQKWLYTCLTSLGLTTTTNLINFWYSRSLETRADEGIRNEVDVLKGMIRFFKREQQKIKVLLTQAGGLKAKFALWLEKYPSLYFFIDPKHPSLPDRIAHFEQRITALENSTSMAS